MKKTKITYLATIMLVLCTSLFARAAEGRFKLKEGDWFEMQFNFSVNYNGNFKRLNFLNEQAGSMEKEITNGQLNLRYQLQKQLPNGNQIYQVSTERIMAKMFWPSLKTWLGYDSYYPPYPQEELSSPKKFLFEMELNQKGNIVRFISDKSNPKDTTLYLSEISPKLKNPFGVSFTLNILTPKLFKNLSELVTFSATKEQSKILEDNKIYARQIIETKEYNIAKVDVNDSITGEIYYLKANGVPGILKEDKASDLFGVLLSDASFPIPPNTMINGTLKDQPNQEIRISFIDSRPFSEPKELLFKTDGTGAFYCPILLTEVQQLKLKIGNKSIDTFMEPGDTLYISDSDDGRHGKMVSKPTTNPASTPVYFSGKAAFNTALAGEMEKLTDYYTESSDDIKLELAYLEKTRKTLNNLLAEYSGKASRVCLDYFKKEGDYFLADRKYYFFDSRRYKPLDVKNPLSIKSGSNVFSNYPSDFFVELDTMDILTNPYTKGAHYNSYIHYSQLIKRDRLGMPVGRFHNDNFLENYYFALASLKGYPFYSQLAQIIDKELRSGSEANPNIGAYYREFMDCCNDPLLTKPLAKLYEAVSELKIGNTFPIKAFTLPDSSIFNLQKLKGKPICLVVFTGPKSEINQYKGNIEKFKPDEVEFVFVRSIGLKYFESEELDSTILKKPNISYIELPKEYLKSKLLLERTKIFMLDQWFRIVENNGEDPTNHIYGNGISKFEKSLRKAIEAKRFSKAEKTAFFKTAGWSFGSILFTFLIGLWIYKVRVRRIKKQEATKRRMKELEIKAIRSQMNPHFIFNALNSIQSLINENQFKQANIYLSKFALLLREVLNNSEKAMVTLSDELKAVELYCQLEQLRFEFQFEISVSPEINSQLIEIPGMIIQPLAENAVVHGLVSKGNEGRLSIEIGKLNDDLCICVSDNGTGLADPKNDRLGQKGFGLKLIEERIKVLNNEGKSARLTLQNRTDNAGAVATLIIPID